MKISPITLLSLALTFIGAIAIFGALPNISRFLIYTFYKPNLTLTFEKCGENQPIYWQELSTKVENTQHQRLNIHNRTDVDLTVEVEFHLDSGWSLRDDNFVKIGLGGIYRKTGKLQPSPLVAGSTLSPAFPFEPEPDDCNLAVIVLPTVHLSEFELPVIGKSLPRYFGEVDLKPVREDFQIASDDQS